MLIKITLAFSFGIPHLSRQHNQMRKVIRLWELSNNNLIVQSKEKSTSAAETANKNNNSMFDAAFGRWLNINIEEKISYFAKVSVYKNSTKTAPEHCSLCRHFLFIFLLLYLFISFSLSLPRHALNAGQNIYLPLRSLRQETAKKRGQQAKITTKMVL